MKSGTLRCLTAKLTLYAVVVLSVEFAAAASFRPTGSMTFARRRHTATLLPNGKVLVTGGANATSTLATAELYDPDNGTFTRTGNMKVARAGHAATLLASGKVLITGGTNAAGPLATAELFDPATGSFTLSGTMTMSRVGHTATLLESGEVLVAGGGNSKAELFNPSTGTFTVVKNMIASRMGQVAARLMNGEILLAGGTDTCCTALGDLFNPATASFSATADGGTQATWLAGTLLHDGRVFLVGGELTVFLGGGGSTRCCLSGPDSVATALIFNSSNKSFSAAGDLSTSRAFHSVTRLGSGEVLVAGGATVHSTVRFLTVFTSVTPLASAELFNPANLTFASASSMTTARAWHTATLLGNGEVLVVGGVNINGNVLSSAELYQ